MRQHMENMLKYSTRVLVDSREVKSRGVVIVLVSERAHLFLTCAHLHCMYSWSRTIGVPHLFLSPLHVSKVIDDRLRQVLQSPQLHLKRLQLLHLGNLRGQNRCYHLRSQETWFLLKPCHYRLWPEGVTLRLFMSLRFKTNRSFDLWLLLVGKPPFKLGCEQHACIWCWPAKHGTMWCVA